MKAVLRTIGIIEDETRRIVERGCVGTDWLRAELSAERFQTVQDFHFPKLQRLELRQSALKERRQKARAIRPNRVQRRITRRPDLRTIQQSHFEVLKLRDVALMNQAQAIRQFGDSCAWLISGGNPCLIRAHYNEHFEHGLPRDLQGLFPLWRMRELHESGRFWVVANDLTRCLTVGDLTIVRAGQPGSLPRIEEIKAELREDSAELFASLTSMRSDDPEHSSLHDEFGLDERHYTAPRELARNAREQRQLERLEERTKLAVSIVRRGGVAVPHFAYWEVINNVIERALDTGHGYEIPEPGVAIVAIRSRPGDEAPRTAERVLAAIGDTDERHLLPGTRLDVHTLFANANLSSFVRPVPLWEIPIHSRVALLSREVYLGFSFAPGTWKAAMRSAGVDWAEEDGYWKCEWNGKKAWMSPLDVEAWNFGARYAQISPRHLAMQIRSALEEQAD